MHSLILRYTLCNCANTPWIFLAIVTLYKKWPFSFKTKVMPSFCQKMRHGMKPNCAHIFKEDRNFLKNRSARMQSQMENTHTYNPNNSEGMWIKIKISNLTVLDYINTKYMVDNSLSHTCIYRFEKEQWSFCYCSSHDIAQVFHSFSWKVGNMTARNMTARWTALFLS